MTGPLPKELTGAGPANQPGPSSREPQREVAFTLEGGAVKNDQQVARRLALEEDTPDVVEVLTEVIDLVGTATPAPQEGLTGQLPNIAAAAVVAELGVPPPPGASPDYQPMSPDYQPPNPDEDDDPWAGVVDWMPFINSDIIQRACGYVCKEWMLRAIFGSKKNFVVQFNGGAVALTTVKESSKQSLPSQ